MSRRLDPAAPRLYVEEIQRSARAERLKARAPRYLLVAVLGILCIVGLKTIVSPPQASSEDDAAAGLVDQGAEELALRFTRTYLSYDAELPGRRDRELRSMMPGDLDASSSLLLNESQSVEWVQVAQHQEALAGGAVIVVAAQVGGEPAPTYLAVPIDRRANGELTIEAYPSIVGPPSVSQAESQDREEVDDQALSDTVSRVIDNYLRGQSANLAADLAPEATYSLPAQRLRVTGVEDLLWAAPDTPAVLITVDARDGARRDWTLTYEVGIDQSGGRTTVTYIETVPNAT